MKPSLFSIFALILGACLNIHAQPLSADSLTPGDTSEAIPEKSVTLIIKTEPAGAAVYLNDSLRGLVRLLLKTWILADISLFLKKVDTTKRKLNSE